MLTNPDQPILDAKQKAKETPLPAKTLTIYKVKYGDLESFVSNISGKDNYSFAEVEECGNDSSHEFEVNGKTAYNKDEIEAYLFGAGKSLPNYSNGDLLNVLCYHHLIPPGGYIVNVCW